MNKSDIIKAAEEAQGWIDHFGIDTAFASVNRYCEALIAAAELLKQVEWQDISAAPKDGTHLLITDGRQVVLGWFGEDWHMLSKGEWLYGTGDDFSTGYYFNPIKPTHFMELPEPPVIIDKEGV